MSFFANLERFGVSSRKDKIERLILRWRERVGLLPLAYVFRDVTSYTGLTAEECLRRALDKESHKRLWFARPRFGESDYRAFYKEDDWYIFRQPWRYRLYTWHFLSKMIPRDGSMVEYGCGAACLTEWMSRRYPKYHYVVADIPSTSLAFAEFRLRGRSNVQVKVIGPGRCGLPLEGAHDLIVCCEVLEHTVNPDEICEHFVEHLAPGGLLYLDFQNADWTGENLVEAAQKRPRALRILRDHLEPLKAIDEDGSWWGLYRKPG